MRDEDTRQAIRLASGHQFPSDGSTGHSDVAAQPADAMRLEQTGNRGIVRHLDGDAHPLGRASMPQDPTAQFSQTLPQASSKQAWCVSYGRRMDASMIGRPYEPASQASAGLSGSDGLWPPALRAASEPFAHCLS
ncbi:MAG TPA: hypothetical protein VD978_25025, partial [Azospirillum sp.]|nr:hypothetical protein [Azospirillum sp.]